MVPTCIVRVRQQLVEQRGGQRQAGVAFQRDGKAWAPAAGDVHAALRPAVGRQRRRLGRGCLRAIGGCCNCWGGAHCWEAGSKGPVQAAALGSRWPMARPTLGATAFAGLMGQG